MYRLAHRSLVKSRDFMAMCLIAIVMEERELCEFLLPAEDAIVAIQWNCESGSPDLEGVLLETNLLVRDVMLVEGLVGHDDGETFLVMIYYKLFQELPEPSENYQVSIRSITCLDDQRFLFLRSILALLLDYRFTI